MEHVMKVIKTGGYTIGKSRRVIRSFGTSQAGHEFLNNQPNNDWTEYNGDLKPGTYAFCGGEWHNVKSLDSSVLAHI